MSQQTSNNLLPDSYSIPTTQSASGDSFAYAKTFRSDSGAFHNIRVAFILSVLFLAGMGSPFAQVTEADMTDKLKALKLELEEQRKLRDKIVAKRWEDKRKHNEERERYNESYDNIKEKLELKNLEKERIKEEIQILQRDVEELKAQRESEKIRFLGLSQLQEANLRELSGQLDKRFPIRITERQQQYNRVRKAAETMKDNPAQVFDSILNLYMRELKLTRSVTAGKQGFLLSDFSPGEGMFLKVGTVAAAYKDEATGRTGLLLRTPNTSGRLYAWREDVAPDAKKFLEAAMGKLQNESAEGLELPMDVLHTRFAGQGYTRKETTLTAATKSYFKNGGIWMWPLVAIAVVAFLLLLERFVAWALRGGDQKYIDRALKLTAENKPDEALKECGKKKNSVALKAVSAVLKSRGKTREIAEKDLQEVLMMEGPKLEKRLATISVLGAAAPLLGLLGTVAGMIGMFESITLHGTSDAKLMANDISIALITTQTGLAIAVPVMILHNFLANRVDGLINKMETNALRALNTLWPNG